MCGNYLNITFTRKIIILYILNLKKFVEKLNERKNSGEKKQIVISVLTVRNRTRKLTEKENKKLKKIILEYLTDFKLRLQCAFSSCFFFYRLINFVVPAKVILQSDYSYTILYIAMLYIYVYI